MIRQSKKKRQRKHQTLLYRMEFHGSGSERINYDCATVLCIIDEFISLDQNFAAIAQFRENITRTSQTRWWMGAYSCIFPTYAMLINKYFINVKSVSLNLFESLSFVYILFVVIIYWRWQTFSTSLQSVYLFPHLLFVYFYSNVWPSRRPIYISSSPTYITLLFFSFVISNSLGGQKVPINFYLCASLYCVWFMCSIFSKHCFPAQLVRNIYIPTRSHFYTSVHKCNI